MRLSKRRFNSLNIIRITVRDNCKKPLQALVIYHPGKTRDFLAISHYVNKNAVLFE